MLALLLFATLFGALLLLSLVSASVIGRLKTEESVVKIRISADK